MDDGSVLIAEDVTANSQGEAEVTDPMDPTIPSAPMDPADPTELADPTDPSVESAEKSEPFYLSMIRRLVPDGSGGFIIQAEAGKNTAEQSGSIGDELSPDQLGWLDPGYSKTTGTRRGISMVRRGRETPIGSRPDGRR